MLLDGAQLMVTKRQAMADLKPVNRVGQPLCRLRKAGVN